MKFTHLHVHSHYSMLDGMSKIGDLVSRCKELGMNSIALTDHGNMYGIKDLSDTCKKINGAAKKELGDVKKKLSEETDETKKAELQKKVDELQVKVDEAKANPFKPIFGIEAYCARRHRKLMDKDAKYVDPESGNLRSIDRSGWHLILLAKNKKGYQNLCKMSSLAFMEGDYGRPRIDKELLEEYHEGIICCSACIGGEIPQKIFAGKIDEAEEAALWFKHLFGDDYYIEIQRHKTDKPNAERSTYERQQMVNPVLIDIAHRNNIKVVCTNDVHFVLEEHGEAHDRLICLSTGKKYADENRMHYTKQEWLKSPEEMAAIFADIPEALENTQEIVDKVEMYDIDSGPIMPKYEIPESFGTEEEYRKKYTEKDLFDEFTQDEDGNVVMSQEDAEAKIKKIGGYEKLYRIKLEADYLAKLAWEGAHVRYGETLTEEQIKQIKFELHIMKTMGFPGYFLIVQDYIRAAREELGVSVGPGRGSAAGSVVAYCLKITDLDPLKYDLLFERFLNPDRISLPDIDVDFEDSGRGKVLDWVTQKYGAEKVAHIITYGTMATKNAMADVARIHDLPLPLVDALKKFVPDKFDDFINPETGKTFASTGTKAPKVKLKNCFKLVPELKAAYNKEYNDVLSNIPGYNENIDLVAQVLKYASQLEDTNRQTGIHACGVIIGADDLTKFAPIGTGVKDGKKVNVTQYDGHVIESVGLIKMDFLGLITLTLIKETIKNLKLSHPEYNDFDIDKIPLDDELTFKLFGEGRTVGVFQFESVGMQKYLRDLKPTVISDLIAMNALYRPGPIAYIPNFIDRKHGREKIEYDLPIMEKYLGDTYGVTVYQEQVMLLSRLLAGFTRGQSDALRKAMGKKIFAMLAELKPKFIEGAMKNPHICDGMDKPLSPSELEQRLEKIWSDWEAFASYAFNKSHAACYAWVAYQTGYLKAHFPAEYMAANLTISKDTITEVTKFMEECKSMNITVKGPNVNESELNFAVNKDGVILFGMGGIKGVGEAAVNAIISEREKNGPYKSIFDFVERVNLTACNKKTIENLALAGAFDEFHEVKREHFKAVNSKGELFLDTLTRYGSRYQEDKTSSANTLFSFDSDISIEIPHPEIPKVEEWSDFERLGLEKELVGIFLTSHPLDIYEMQVKYGANITMAELSSTDLITLSKKHKEIRFGGLVSNVRGADGMLKTKRGDSWAKFTLEDYNGSHEFALFGRDYEKFINSLHNNQFVWINAAIQLRGSDWKYPKKVDETVLENWEVKIKSIDLLSEVKDTIISDLTINIPLSKLTSEIVESLESLSHTQEGGKVKLHIQIIDDTDGSMSVVKTCSRTKFITINRELMNYLKQLEQESTVFKSPSEEVEEGSENNTENQDSGVATSLEKSNSGCMISFCVN